MISDFEREQQAMVATEPVFESTLSENIVAGFGNERREKLPLASRRIANSAAQQKAERIAFDTATNGRVSFATVDNFTNSITGKLNAYDFLDYMKRANINVEYDPDEFRKEEQAQYATLREADQEIFDRSTGWGTVAENVGRMGAMFTDEMYIALMPLSLGPSNTIISAGLRMGALGLATEIPAIPMIYDFSKRIGAQYGKKEAFIHAASAFGMGAAMGVVGKSVQKLIGSTAKSFKGLTLDDIEGMAAKSSEIQGTKTYKEPDPIAKLMPDEAGSDPVLARGERFIAESEAGVAGDTTPKMSARETIERQQILEWMDQGEFVPPDMLRKYPDILPKEEITRFAEGPSIKPKVVQAADAAPTQMADDFVNVRRERTATARKAADKDLLVVEGEVKAKKAEIETIQKEIDDVAVGRDKKRDARKELRSLKRQIANETDPKVIKRLKKQLKKAGRVRQLDLNVEKQQDTITKLQEEITTLETETLPLKQATVERLNVQAKTLRNEVKAKTTEIQAKVEAAKQVKPEQIASIQDYQLAKEEEIAFKKVVKEACSND